MAAPVQLFWGKVMSLVTTGTKSLDLNSSTKATKITVWVVFAAFTTAGTLVVEGAHDEAYAGTWETLGTIAWSAASTNKSITVSGPFHAVRVRWTANVVGGLAEVYAKMVA